MITFYNRKCHRKSGCSLFQHHALF